MSWWNRLVNWGPPPAIEPGVVHKTLNPAPTSPRPPPPRSQAGTRRVGVMPQPSRITERPPDPAPLLLRMDRAIRPTATMWNRANALFEHPTGCRCSTCTTTAELAWLIRDHDQRQQPA